jgi:hypothetical protein
MLAGKVIQGEIDSWAKIVILDLAIRVGRVHARFLCTSAMDESPVHKKLGDARLFFQLAPLT